MPASVGARPGTSVAAAAHSSAPKPKPMPANAAPSALRAARRLRRTATRSSTAIARPITSPIGKPPVAAPSIGSPDIATFDARAGELGGRVLEPLARLGVEVRRGLVIADRRVGDVSVVRDARILDRDRRVVASRRRPARRRSRAFQVGVLALKTSVACVPDWAGEPLLEQVLRLLGLDARDREVVLERAADGDGAADDRRDPEEHDERGDPWAAADHGGDGGEEGGHGAALYTDSVEKSTQSKNQMECYILGRWPGSGNARSARPASRSATRACGCSPSRASPARRSTRSPEAADVSRATVFTYFPTKEEIVFGDGSVAIDELGRRLRERPEGETTIVVVRAWLDELVGWFEPELVVQQQLDARGADRRRPPPAALRRGRAPHRGGARGRARPGPGARRRACRSRAGRGPPRSGGDRGRTDAGGGSDALARPR